MLLVNIVKTKADQRAESCHSYEQSDHQETAVPSYRPSVVSCHTNRMEKGKQNWVSVKGDVDLLVQPSDGSFENGEVWPFVRVL